MMRTRYSTALLAPPLSECCVTDVTPSCDALHENHLLLDQFGNHPDLLVQNPELLCLPSFKTLPEPGVLLSLGPGMMLLGWLDCRRRRRGIGR